MAVQPGRNEPCFCGSGKKFKHCHGGLAAAASHPPAPSSAHVLSPQEIGALVALVNQDRLGEAEIKARSSLASHPDAGILWKILSVALVRQRKDALQALRRAAELMPNDAEALRNLGAALHDQGQWAAALESLRQALKIEPDDADTLVDAADAMRGLGRAREAIPLYQRALARSPQLVEAQNNLGNAFLELGEFANAVLCYRAALALKPRDAQILCNLGNALRQLGRPDEATDLCRQAIALEPGLSVAHNNLGLALAALGQRADAAASYRQALHLNPAYVEALNNLGNVLRDLGERRSAVPLYARAIELDPRRAESHCNLGTVLFELRQVEEAVASYRQALALQPDYAPAHLSLAFALRQQRRAADAELSCQAALAINPDYVEALAFLGELRADRGQFAEAEKLFQRAIEINPDFSFAFASIATHRKMSSDDTKWLQGAQALAAKSLPLGHEISLHYALGKYFDDLGQYDEAFEHYREANELTKRYGVKYEAAKLTQRSDEIIRSFDTALVRAAREGASVSQAAVFIVGMPRSGTSLTEQILASHPEVFGGGEVSFWNAAYEAYRDAQLAGKSAADLIPGMASDYLKLLASLSEGASRVIDKMPANFMYAGLIHAALPQARIIHMRRHPFDTCLSIYFQNFFNIGPYANDLDDLAHYYSEYLRVTRHWRAVLPAASLLEVPYEALIEDQEGWSRRML
ncbi:MAG TPA: tetratricopeptide repeat protein, partial [Steroidobacteraceae bacterium]|nr:tetratricopeptide repeat protein [Steroidobacteraceae bacterium]